MWLFVYWFPEWIIKKKITINPKNKDDKCFQYAITAPLNYRAIKSQSERISNVKPFINKDKWKGINYLSNIDDWKTFAKNNPWHCGVVVITTAQLHSTKRELRFCAVSNLARSISEICDDEDFWQWFQLEIRLNTFRRSTIPHKQFISIIIIIIIIALNFSYIKEKEICLPYISKINPSCEQFY